MNQIKWVFEDFHQLNLDVLYQILQARAEVFVVEQRCNYLYPDGHDLVSVHLTGWLENELAAYARIIPPGIVYQEASIGRVLTRMPYRRSGIGKELMLEAIKHTTHRFAVNEIHISAQYYLLEFYTAMGFKTVGEQYLEDDIPHIGMIYKQ